jgi:hypothetical protein
MAKREKLLSRPDPVSDPVSVCEQIMPRLPPTPGDLLQ